MRIRLEGDFHNGLRHPHPRARSLLYPGRPHPDHDRLPVADGICHQSIDAVELRINAGLVANAAAGFGVSTILTTVAEKSFSGPMFDEITAAFPGQRDRPHLDEHLGRRRVIKQVNEIGKPRIVLAGLWTAVCIVGPALSALEQGFEVYVIADACGDVSDEAHERAMHA